jgi:Tol biopolymer transport system component
MIQTVGDMVMGKASIKKNGISKFNKEKIKYFSQIGFREIITLCDNMPDIQQIISVIADPQILSMKIIETMEGKSQEGQYISGCKLIAEIELKQKILYSTDSTTQSIHVIENTFIQSAYIVVPKSIKGTDIKWLLKENRYYCKVFIEDIVIKKIDERNIFTNIFSLLLGTFRPTFEICYSNANFNKKSDVFICYDDGINPTNLTIKGKDKNICPKWSPTGNEISYLAKEEGKFSLYIYNLNSQRTRKITDHNRHGCITSYCWNNKGDKIYLTGNIRNTKDIFSINIKDLSSKQLTFGDDLVKSYNPKCSYAGEKIGYLKIHYNTKDLYMMDSLGVYSQQITNCGHIKDFNWSKENDIVYIHDNHLGKPCICVINIKNLDKKYVAVPNNIFSLKKLKFSPMGKYITYIANNCSTEDIYLHHVNKNKTFNLTKNISNISISDYDWGVNEETIFYGANNSGYYNIYGLDLNTNHTMQITSLDAYYIQVEYRPRII